MAFNDKETSVFESNPIELYRFRRGTTQWLYTSNDQDQVFETLTYKATQIRRSKIEATQDIGKLSNKIELVRTAPFLTQFIATSPVDTISIEIIRLQAGEEDFAVIFKGRVTNVRFNGDIAEVTCNPVFTALKRPGLRRTYQATCPHILYGNPCGVSKTAFGINGNIDTLAGVTLSSLSWVIDTGNPAIDEVWFVGGILEVDLGGFIERRFITGYERASGSITLNLPLTGVAIGMIATAFPGCDHSTETCFTKYSNINNYGGYPDIPSKNPMDGTSIF
jgi:uncharacterized phage protein (TIGR02218 family)